jgi:hypothetical protein
MRAPLLPLAIAACVGLLASSIVIGQSSGADARQVSGPEPTEIPVPHIATSLGVMSGVRDLPARAGLPEVMVEQDTSIDARKLIVTGASRHGKAAMIAAAFDDRLMGAPVVTGGGGGGTYRAAGPRGSETLDIMQTKYPNWFSPNLHQFRGQRDRLPFDQHWFLALAAPRPFIALEGDTDTISLPEAVRQSILGARPAYALHGAADRLGVHFGRHGHAFTSEDWTAMLDFFDAHLRGRPATRPFDRFPTEQELDAALAAAREAARPGQ